MNNSHQSPNRGSTLRQKDFLKDPISQIIDTLFELITQSPQNGEDVLISGFGKFSVGRKKQARRSTNPQTGEGDDATTQKGGDIQVLWRFAGRNEWGRLTKECAFRARHARRKIKLSKVGKFRPISKEGKSGNGDTKAMDADEGTHCERTEATVDHKDSDAGDRRVRIGNHVKNVGTR